MMPRLNWPALAAQSPILAALPAALRAAARLRALSPGQILFRQGDRPMAMYYVIAGELRLIRHARTGHETILQRARQGPLAEASLDQPAYHCDAVAAAPSQVLAVPRGSMRAALADAALRSAWIAHLSRELRRSRAQCERLSLRSAQDRVLHCLESEGDGGRLRLTQSKKDWAAELGLTHEALYRALKALELSNRIKVADRDIRLI